MSSTSQSRKTSQLTKKSTLCRLAILLMDSVLWTITKRFQALTSVPSFKSARVMVRFYYQGDESLQQEESEWNWIVAFDWNSCVTELVIFWCVNLWKKRVLIIHNVFQKMRCERFTITNQSFLFFKLTFCMRWSNSLSFLLLTILFSMFALFAICFD